MKRFSTFTEVSNRELAKQAFGHVSTFRMIFDNIQVYSPSTKGFSSYIAFPLLLDNTTQKILTGEVTQVNMHITNLGSIYRGNLFRRQGKKSSISASRYVPQHYNLINGIEKNGGVLVILKGDVLIAAGDDLYTRPDENGRRWVASAQGFNSFFMSQSDWQVEGRLVTPVLAKISWDIDNKLRPKVDQTVHKLKRRLDRMVKTFKDFDEIRELLYKEKQSKPLISLTDDEIRNFLRDFYDGTGSLAYMIEEYNGSKAGSTMYGKFYQIFYYLQQAERNELYSLDNSVRYFLRSDPKFMADIKKWKSDLIKFYIDLHRKVWKKYADSFKGAIGDQLTPTIASKGNKYEFTEHVMNNLEILEVHFMKEMNDNYLYTGGERMTVEEVAEYVRKTHRVKVIEGSSRSKIISAVKSLRAKYERTT